MNNLVAYTVYTYNSTAQAMLAHSNSEDSETGEIKVYKANVCCAAFNESYIRVLKRDQHILIVGFCCAVSL